MAIVTGASRGLGRAIALELARAGAAVAVTARSQADLDQVAGEVESLGGEALPLSCDVSSEARVRRMAERVREELGPVTVLVNNAGVIEPIGLIGELDGKEWERALAVSLAGPFHASQAVLADFAARGGGVILNVSSGAGYNPKEGWSAYCSTKAGLAMLTRSIAHELGGRGVLAYGFRPGVVDTEMHVKIRASGLNEISRIPREELGRPEPPARMAAQLCLLAPEDLNGSDVSLEDEELRARLEREWDLRSRG